MACKTNLVTYFAEGAVAALEAVLAELNGLGAISPTESQSITTYVTGAVQTLDTVIAELKAGTATLPKIAAIVQTLVTEFNALKALLPPQLVFIVNTANIAIQAVLGAIEAEIGTALPAPTPAPAGATPHIQVLGFGHPTLTLDSSVHTSEHKLNGWMNRLKAVRAGVMAHPVTAPAGAAPHIHWTP